MQVKWSIQAHTRAIRAYYELYYLCGHIWGVVNSNLPEQSLPSNSKCTCPAVVGWAFQCYVRRSQLEIICFSFRKNIYSETLQIKNRLFTVKSGPDPTQVYIKILWSKKEVHSFFIWAHFSETSMILSETLSSLKRKMDLVFFYFEDTKPILYSDSFIYRQSAKLSRSQTVIISLSIWSPSLDINSGVNISPLLLHSNGKHCE